MAHLWMQAAVQQAAIDERASPQTSTNGDIDEAAQAASGAPTGLGQHRSVHIGVERNRHAERLANCTGKVEVPPGELRRGCDVTVRGRFRIRIDGSEGSDSNRGNELAGAKEIDGLPDCLLGRCGGKLGEFGVFGAAAGPTYELRSPSFDPSQTRHPFLV